MSLLRCSQTASTDRYSEWVGAFQRQVNAAYVDPAFIAKVHKKLDRHPELLSEVRSV
jgi:HTH-type transcriptional regulator/antitoxin MqsA